MIILQNVRFGGAVTTICKIGARHSATHIDIFIFYFSVFSFSSFQTSRTVCRAPILQIVVIEPRSWETSENSAT